MAGLTGKQAAFVAAVEDGKTVSAAAALAHVNPTTHYRWMVANETYRRNRTSPRNGMGQTVGGGR